MPVEMEFGSGKQTEDEMPHKRLPCPMCGMNMIASAAGQGRQRHECLRCGHREEREGDERNRH